MNPSSPNADLSTDLESRYPAGPYDEDDSQQVREQGSQVTSCSGCKAVFSDTNFGRHKDSSAHRDYMLRHLGYNLEPRGVWQCVYPVCAPSSPARPGRNPGSCSRQDTMKRHYCKKHGLKSEEALELAKTSKVSAHPSPLPSPSTLGEGSVVHEEATDEIHGLPGAVSVGDSIPDDAHLYIFKVEEPQDTCSEQYHGHGPLSLEVPRSPFQFNPALLSPTLPRTRRLHLDGMSPSLGAFRSGSSPYTDVSSIASLSPVSIDHDYLLPSGSPASLGTSSVDWDSQSIDTRSVLLSTTGSDHLVPDSDARGSFYSAGTAHPYYHEVSAHSPFPPVQQPGDRSSPLFTPDSLTTDGVRMHSGLVVPNSVIQEALASYYQRMDMQSSNAERMLTLLSLNGPHSQPQNETFYLTGT
ncbi:hypothetical protein BDV98DRAFT_568475, partial [Pterulicium gracile]